MGFKYKWIVGRLEIGWWNDTGTPPLKVCCGSNKLFRYAKFFLYKRTLWISWNHPKQNAAGGRNE